MRLRLGLGPERGWRWGRAYTLLKARSWSVVWGLEPAVKQDIHILMVEDDAADAD